MSVLVVGSVAYDSVVTPTGSRSEALGGSATYFCVAGSYFAPVSVVAVVGQDFRSEDLVLIKERGVDTTGIARREGKSFRWSGEYGEEDLNARTTLDTQLNVFAEFSPRLSADHKRVPYVFLANIDPELQRDVLSQVSTQPMLVALDTMNFWIEGKNDQLRGVVRDIDVLFMDESEARQFAGHANLVKAAREIMDLGPTVVVLKRGQHGVLLFQPGSVFAAPAFPLEDVVDPTGAGDAFAGGVYRLSRRDRRPEPRWVPPCHRARLGDGLLRRGKLQPRQVGLPLEGGHRLQVPGLRGAIAVRCAPRR